MNERGSKKILFNKSSLLSLKTELLRKQEEVLEKKRQPQHKLENFKPPPSKGTENNEKNSNKSRKKTFKDNLCEVDTEELEACRKAKLALEKKAELYEHLSDSTGSSQLTEHFLVDFNTKKQLEARKPTKPSSQKLNVEEEEYNSDDIEDESEWTEFTDCLGRTRKCLKTDLQVYLEKDVELMKVINKDHTSTQVEDALNETKKEEPEKPLLVQKTNDYLQSLREKWERKEQELLSKDKDIHYQDLLFDEARMHGVGYFSFSTDEAERRRQMEELMKTREETLRAQKDAEAKRKQRDELVAARVAAARARRRLRAGLPPDEPQENKKDFTACLLEFLTEKKNEADNQAKEEERKQKEEKEKERQKLREAYIREWDVGKEGVDDKVKKFREMSQEEYVEQQRAKRIDEFAPFQSSFNKRSDNAFDEKGKMLCKTAAVENKTWSEVRPLPNPPSPTTISDLSEENPDISQKGLYFSSSKKANIIRKNVHYKNFVKAQEPTPIVNELSDEEDSNKATQRNCDNVEHAEVAPPVTYDYYGPVPKHPRTQKPFESDIRESYAQGAKSLETKPSNLQLPKHYDFTFD